MILFLRLLLFYEIATNFSFIRVWQHRQILISAINSLLVTTRHSFGDPLLSLLAVAGMEKMKKAKSALLRMEELLIVCSNGLIHNWEGMIV